MGFVDNNKTKYIYIYPDLTFNCILQIAAVPALGSRSSELLFHPDPLGESEGGQSLLKPPSDEGEKTLLQLDVSHDF